MAEKTIPVRVTNMSSLLGHLGSGATMACVVAYFVVVAPATDAGDRERAAHAAVRAYKAGLHAQLVGADSPYRGNDLYDDDTDELDADGIARMIAVPNDEVVEWALGPRPPWWEIGSVGDWGDLPPDKLGAGIREALEVLSAGAWPDRPPVEE